MKDLRIRVFAGLGWTLGVAITGLMCDLDWRRGLTLLGVAAWMCGGVFTAMSCHRDSARLTRDAVFHQRRWSDQSEDLGNVVNLR